MHDWWSFLLWEREQGKWKLRIKHLEARASEKWEKKNNESSSHSESEN